MEGYLVRIPSDAWLGAGNKSPKVSASKRTQPAQLLYYELGEGFLRGYASPDDVEPVDEFQLTSFHVQVDVMPSMRMFQVVATSKTSPRKLVQTWGSRVLNWNRHVFGGDDIDPAALEASKRELLAAFQTHCCASWFTRPLSLGADPTSAVTDKRSIVDSTSFQPPADVTKPSTEALAPSKPWWMFTAPQTRRISASSLRKS